MPHGNPTGLLLAQPNAMILYATLAKGPKLPREYQLNSTRHFMRELNSPRRHQRDRCRRRFPELSRRLRRSSRSCTSDGELTLRIAYNLFTQKPKEELQRFRQLVDAGQARPGRRHLRHNGAGEMLVYSAADFEDFRVAAARHAADDGRRSGAGGAPARRTPLAVAAARHLRRDDQPRARRVREGQSRHSARRPALVLRPCRNDQRAQHRPRSPRWAAASPCSTAWRSRANISSSATAPRRPRPRRRSSGCWRPACRSAPAPMRRASPATTPGSRCPGWSRRKTVGGLTLYPVAQPARPRDGAAAVDREEHLVLERSGQEGADQGRPARRPRVAVGRLFLGARRARSPTCARC